MTKRSAQDRDVLHSYTLEQLVDIAKESPGCSTRPWFKWFPGNYLGSYRRQAMSLAGQGAYMVLLCREWQSPDCGLPSDFDELGMMAGATKEEWTQVGRSVVGMFRPSDGRLYSMRLLMCRAEMAMQSEQCRDAVMERWRKEQENGSSDTVVLRANIGRRPPSLSKSLSKSCVDLEIKKEKKEGRVIQRFVPPTTDEVKQYCLERKNGIDAEYFVNYYSAVGWMRGKTKISSWKRVVATWEKRDEKGQVNPSSYSKNGNYIP